MNAERLGMSMRARVKEKWQATDLVVGIKGISLKPSCSLVKVGGGDLETKNSVRVDPTRDKLERPVQTGSVCVFCLDHVVF